MVELLPKISRRSTNSNALARRPSYQGPWRFTNLICNFAETGMQEMSDKFNEEGSEVYKDEYFNKAEDAVE